MKNLQIKLESGVVKYITTSEAPEPAGHYSQAAWFGGHLFISGQLPVNVNTRNTSGESVMESFGAQAERALANMIRVLTASGGSIAELAKVTAYIVGVANWDTFDRVYTEVLGPARPARVIVPVPELHYGYLVEVDAIAVGVEAYSLER